MSAFGQSLNLLRAVLPAGGAATLNRAVYEAAYRLPAVADSGFFNGGYRPLLPGLLGVPGLAGAPSQANLYEFVLRTHPGRRVQDPRTILDIGCGAGGGLEYAGAAFPRAGLTGVDASAAAIAAARRRLRAARLIQARGEALPLRDGGFDLVVSVGTMTNVGAGPFMAEAARVLAPGGILTLSAGTGCCMDDIRAQITGAAGAAGLRLLRLTDITAQAMSAITADAPHHRAMIATLPFWLRAEAAEWAALPGSARHRRYHAGQRRDVAAVLQRMPAS
ncbi:class I SAM-dependent methyltransferase [Humitalea sp. 24SJ18S-53]|uniref:class I SAM-dependent methyltransferase n=1 Tax=Humitalea sp. 24SJ18S-53 TaxID=3422307 RepID=UPI003D6774F4